MRYARRAGLFTLLWCFFAAAAPAASEPARFAVVASSTVDSKADDASQLKAQLAQVLTQKGQRVLDAADADWVLKAAATCKTLERVIEPGGGQPAGKIVAANCDVTLSLTRVDSQEAVFTTSLFGKAPSATARESVRRAFESVAAQFEQQADAALAAVNRQRPVAIWLFGAGDRATAGAIADGLSKLAGSDAKLLDFSAELSKLEVTPSSGDGVDLAKQLDDAGLPVAVERASGGKLTLRRDPARAFRTSFVVQPLGGDPKKLAGRLDRAQERIAGGLQGDPWLVSTPDAKAAGLTVGGVATVTPKGELSVRLIAMRGSESAPFAYGAGKGPRALEEAIEKLEQTLPQKLAALQPLAGQQKAYAALPKALEESKKLKALEVVRTETPDVFPARASRYAKDLPVASLWVKSAGKPLTVTAKAVLDGYSKGARLGEPVSVGADPVRLPLEAALDEARLLGANTPGIAQLMVELDWTQDGAERAQSFVLPVRVLERNAVDWKEPQAAAAFVNPRDEAVKALTAAALAAPGDSAGLPPNVARAVRVVEALSALKLKYAPDPVAPFGSGSVDFVEGPSETMQRRTGDCDDFAVLAASALEAAGVGTRLVTTPGHLLVAYDSGVAPLHATFADFKKGEAVAAGGRAFVPLESTALGQGYAAAWSKGAAEVARHGKALPGVSVREAWQQYPPIALPSQPAPKLDGLEAAIPAALAAASKAAQQSLEARLAAVDAKLKAKPADPKLVNERAFLLACAGRLDDALGAARPLAEKSPRLKLTVANLLVLKGQLKDAEQLLAPNADGPEKKLSAAYRYNLGIVRYLGGNDRAAADELAKAIALDPQVAAPLGDGSAEVRGDEKSPPSMLKADLTAMLRAAKDKPDAFSKGAAEPGRRGADPESKVVLAESLAWLLE